MPQPNRLRFKEFLHATPCPHCGCEMYRVHGWLVVDGSCLAFDSAEGDAVLLSPPTCEPESVRCTACGEKWTLRTLEGTL
jgi:hypothetical protein